MNWRTSITHQLDGACEMFLGSGNSLGHHIINMKQNPSQEINNFNFANCSTR